MGKIQKRSVADIKRGKRFVYWTLYLVKLSSKHFWGTLLHKMIRLHNTAEQDDLFQNTAAQDDLFAEHCWKRRSVCRTLLYKTICLQNTAAQDDLFAEHCCTGWSVCITLLHKKISCRTLLQKIICFQNSDAQDDLFAEHCCTRQSVCRTLLNKTVFSEEQKAIRFLNYTKWCVGLYLHKKGKTREQDNNNWVRKRSCLGWGWNNL